MVPNDELDEHEEKLCPRRVEPCRLGCGVSVRLDRAPWHESEVCGKRVPFGPALELHMAQHERAGDVHRLREQQARLVEYPPGPVRA